MRDKSDMPNSTKVNTQTEFRAENIFKMDSKCAKIFGRVENIFMTLITSNFYRSHIQSQLHDFVDDSLSSVSKFVISYGESRTWDGWATYFEHKDLDTLSFRESGILFMLCTRMQQSLLNEVSDSSFSWGNISSEEKAFHLRCVLELEKYLYENSRKSIYHKIVYNFMVLSLCNTFWINFFEEVNDYDRLCYDYIQIILKASREYIEKNISESIVKPEVVRLNANIDSKFSRLESGLEKTDVKIFVTDLSYSELEILKSKYSVSDNNKMWIFLKDNSALFYLLKDAYPEFVKYFNFQQISLDISQGLDGSSLQSLDITIYTSEDVDTCLLKLNEFRKSYWFDLPWNLIKNTTIGFDC
jgi:hypothetical protein